MTYVCEKPRYRIRLVYGLTRNGDGSFQVSSKDNRGTSVQGERRLAMAALLIQTAAAEFLYRQGLKRKTFIFDQQHVSAIPPVTTFRFSFTDEEAFRLQDGSLWSTIHEQLKGLPDREDTIDLVVMSFTRYDPNAKVAKAHTALGGDRLALFGGGCLYSWPETIEQVVERFLDERPCDKSLFDDSGGRGKMWSITATTIGALLHELGHCLSLPHPTGKLGWKGGGIMARGFDHFNRLFVGFEDGRVITQADEPFFDRSSAIRLFYHKYLNPMGYYHASPTPASWWNRLVDQDQIKLSRDSATQAVMITAPFGIRHIAFLVNGDQADHEEYHLSEPPPNNRTLMPDKQLIEQRLHLQNTRTEVSVSVCDSHGNIVVKRLKEI
ncbi:uncharacterized protein Gasu_24130 [Galdieria sulphuraria]|uniref:Zinc metalloproteinase n=1 Tax=Galdieria sulphuraria TaxID=130081 RepID=M2XJG8_GALSU|nr:uncharacterized protein Gasu_24130 [Galdieria sulphuraria]EME30262.1 hypothetical protein Gasu_24130 [Galdieria sulphuraria]|eukprot:XP_005706782.1 hypothetical protein Gasu_24130 [Galdieria sulphuraria]